MNKKYYEKAVVRKLELVHGEGGKQIIEAYATLIVEKAPNENYELYCFLGGGVDAERVNRLNLKKDDAVLVEFYLLEFKFGKQEKLSKQIKVVRDNRYSIQGEITSISAVTKAPVPNYYNMVLNCGLYVRTNMATDEKIKTGDYLSLEGRLDAHIIKKLK